MCGGRKHQHNNQGLPVEDSHNYLSLSILIPCRYAFLAGVHLYIAELISPTIFRFLLLSAACIVDSLGGEKSKSLETKFGGVQHEITLRSI